MLKDDNRSEEYINKLDQLAKHGWILSMAANHLMEVFWACLQLWEDKIPACSRQ